jgi:integral membrane protein (TIGR00529 family)
LTGAIIGAVGQMLNPSLALLISILVILVPIRLKVHPGFAIFAGSIVIMLLVLPFSSVPSLMLRTLIDKQTLTLLVVVASAMTMSSLMEIKGLLTRLATTMESIGPRLAMHLVPAVIGLVPMPAGALVSATAVKGVAQRLKLTPEQGTFINYWFRHIWEFSIPVYPTIIVTSAVLAIPIAVTVKTLAPITALVISLGVLVSYQLLKKTPRIRTGTRGSARSIVYNLFTASWPILLLIVLIFSGVDAMIAFPVTLILLIGQQRAKPPHLKQAFKYGLNPRVLLLLYAIMLYKATVESSGVARTLVSDMQAVGLPPLLMLIGLPLLMGLATGFGPAFAGLALPLLVPYILVDSSFSSGALILAFVSGMMGMLLSPTHLCFILSAEHFEAALVKVYRYTLPLALVIETIVIAVYYITK